jgi:hypothetical protein
MPPLSLDNLRISRRGPPARPFGWEIVADGVEIDRSKETFRARYEAIADGERVLGEIKVAKTGI